ncbi:hypothetical protein FRB94_003087 [Tulasnella sp. JGI-2019a]|nr:hypothetical protein FRB94_003087 [Tulasnella sp. JGI-2019a]KAG9006189.1 hypothetical protein FRB93_008982 [Tulasnella sp. JGI-2019a]KAG9027347.1 hypothetical protein FRB95_007834 [Tulasnella sp. JGI-2019a]
MADLFNAQYAPRISNTGSSLQQQQQQQQHHSSSSSSSYPPFSAPHSNDSDHQQDSREAPKMEAKPQATFLTKLYALLERPEYQSMIRWDANGEQIIVERPEQLALHVLPSIYRQSRFASFSRQLNIYGFMRKVNLRNVDPAIDDPDASTWSHPTLTRQSPSEVVANFKRRVPPRLPKTRKRSDTADGLPRLDVSPSSVNSHPPHHPNAPQNAGPIGLPTIPMSMAAAAAQSDLGIGRNNSLGVPNSRPRGLSAPGPYGQQQQYASSSSGGGLQMPNSAGYQTTGSKWGQPQQQQQYASRTPLPPLSIPGGSSGSSSGGSSGLFTGGSFSAHPTTLGNLSPLSSVHDSHHHSSHHPYSAGHHDSSYGGSSSHHQQSSHHGGGGRDPASSSVFAYGSGAFGSDPNASHGGHSSGNNNGGSHNWSSYLPPASSLGQGQSGGSTPLPFPAVQRPSLPTANSFSSGSYAHQTSSHHGHHPMSSPDSASRPATGYGNTSPYDMDSAPDSSRPLTPNSNSLRPSSAKSLQAPQNSNISSLSIRNSRPRRRSDAVTQPYPSPMYGTAPEQSHKSGAGIQLPSVSSVDPYHQLGSAASNAISADFAYSPTNTTTAPHHDTWNKSLRPSTSTSSISATSTSMIHTPPIMEDHEEGGSGHTATNGNGVGRGRGASTGSNGSLGADNDISRYNDFFTITPSSMSSANDTTGGSSATTAFDHNNPFASLLEEERKSTASSKSLSPMGLHFNNNSATSPGIMDFKDPFKTLID